MTSSTGSTSTDVTCQHKSCTSRVLARDTQAATDERARTSGWRIWDGPTLDGATKRFMICPDHANIPRPRRATVQEYDTPLW